MLGVGAVSAALPAFAGAAIEIVAGVGLLAAGGAGALSARFIFGKSGETNRNAAPAGGRLVYNEKTKKLRHV